jgi:hypothetical protein
MVSDGFRKMIIDEAAQAVLDKYGWFRRSGSKEKFDVKDESALECIVLEGATDNSVECHSNYVLKLFSDGSYKLSAEWVTGVYLPGFYPELDPGAKMQVVKFGQIDAITSATRRYEMSFAGKIARSERPNISHLTDPDHPYIHHPAKLLIGINETLNALADAYSFAEAAQSDLGS